MRNYKTTKLIFRVSPASLLLANEAAHFRIANCLEKSVQFLFEPLGEEFNAAIGQITHRADHFKPRGDSFYGVTKPDALNAAQV